MATKKEETVNLAETVKVVGTKREKGKQHLTEGKVYEVHPLTADHLIEKGHAKKHTGK